MCGSREPIFTTVLLPTDIKPVTSSIYLPFHALLMFVFSEPILHNCRHG